jgi:hypothetical protein
MLPIVLADGADGHHRHGIPRRARPGPHHGRDRGRGREADRLFDLIALNVIILGQFRAADFGDMWRTKELELMCPNNPIGTIDLYFASSHGAIASGSLPFVHGLQPRVALMQNGTRKGGAPGPMQTIFSSPGLEALWQMHWSYNAKLEATSTYTNFRRFQVTVDETIKVPK